MVGLPKVMVQEFVVQECGLHELPYAQTEARSWAEVTADRLSQLAARHIRLIQEIKVAMRLADCCQHTVQQVPSPSASSSGSSFPSALQMMLPRNIVLAHLL